MKTCVTVFFFFSWAFRFHHDDAAAVHQLQTEVCGPPPLEDAHVQSPQYIHRRPLCLRHQDAHDVQNRMSQRWYVFSSTDVEQAHACVSQAMVI